MDREKYKEDLKDIRDIMDRSSRFISLSGLSGIVAGTIALLGVWLLWDLVYSGIDPTLFKPVELSLGELQRLLLISTGTMVLSIGGVIFLTTRETRKRGQKVWDFQTKRILINLAIPLAAGGSVCLIFLSHGFANLLPSLTLIFYGLALINVGKYTVEEIRSLGVIELSIGIVSLLFPGYTLVLWSLGFGLFHIIYGVMAHRKYNS